MKSTAPHVECIRHTLLVLGAMLVISGCAASQAPPDRSSGSQGEVVMTADSTASASDAEPVSNLQYDGKVVSARVVSTGCTADEHFSVEHTVQGGVCLATVTRNKADLCRRAPMMIDISIPWERPAACAGQSINFTNPVLEGGEDPLSRRLPGK